MSDKENLAEMIGPVLKNLPWGEVSSHTADDIADHLISNGVVVREKGEWVTPTIIGGRAFDIPHCSVCEGVPCGVDENTKFCAHCGADMRKGENG